MVDRQDAHYREMEVEPYSVMKSMGVFEEYCLAAAVKYLMRAGKKAGVEDIADIYKAYSVLGDLIRHIEEEG